MSNSWVTAAAAELVLVSCTVAALGGALGRGTGAAVLAGALLMASIGLPSVAAVLWGRSRSNAAFLGSFVAALLVKFMTVGAAVAWVWLRSGLPRLEFAAGLLFGWLLGFGVLALLLRRPAGARTAGS